MSSSPKTDVCRRVVIRGRVQGVFFRDSTRRQAEFEGVNGWISNRPDGSVEARFEGAPEAVDRLVAYCSSGPSGAVVERLEQSDCEVEGLAGFEIR